MKKLLLIFFIAGLLACIKEEAEGEKKVGYVEYTMTVASAKVQGVVGTGAYALSDVYAVKKGDADDWSPFSGLVKGFEYEPGYEYVIEVGETSFLDYRRGDPAWTEYELIKLVSRNEKQSEGLPENFIPDWWSPPLR